MTSLKRKRCAAKSARIIGLFLLLAFALSLSTAGAASSTTAPGGKISSARLTKRSFTATQATVVKLIYKFSKESTHFSYRLQIKKKVGVKEHGEWRKVTRWRQVKMVEKRGHFKGEKSMTVKKLFAGKPVNVGSYRLRLSADRGVKILSFEVIKAKKAIEVRAGLLHTCALRPNGTVWCWGANAAGELGDGSTYYFGDSTPVEVKGISTATQVAAGSEYTCALLSDGKVECWGYNAAGELGDGSTDSSSTPVEVTGISTATQIAAGGDHTCALLSDGKVECWGYNDDGELGDGSTKRSSTPVEVTGIQAATQVAVGGGHTCALLSNGRIECWGSNKFGQLGNGTTDSSSIPVEVTGISTATQVEAGASHTCALLSGGTVWCWGLDDDGELGNVELPEIGHIHSSVPVEVPGIQTATQVAAGSYHTCALLSNGTVECWGENVFGQLGNGSTLDSSPIPVEVTGISTATQVTAGFSHTCALLSNGKVECWGHNFWGQLGDGTEDDSSIPVEVTGF